MVVSEKLKWSMVKAVRAVRAGVTGGRARDGGTTYKVAIVGLSCQPRKHLAA